MSTLRALTHLTWATLLVAAGYALPLTLGLVSMSGGDEALPEAAMPFEVSGRLLVRPEEPASAEPVPEQGAELAEGRADADAEIRAEAREEGLAIAIVTLSERERLARPEGTDVEGAPGQGAPTQGNVKEGKGKRRCEPSTDAIVRVGASSFVIRRDLVSYFAKHPGQLDGLGWVERQDGPDGKAVGYRLGGIKCGSELHLAGLRNGDVIHSINGLRVTSLPGALLAYAKLKNEDVIQLEVDRKGQVQHLSYDLG